MENQSNGKIAYSIAECAALLGISVCLCRRLVQQHTIPALRLGERRIIIPRKALEKMLNEIVEKQSNAAD